MALKNYVVLKGRPTALALDDDDSPHIEVRMDVDGVDFRLAINARSAISPHDLLYRKQDPFAHPIVAGLRALPEGVTDIRGERPELALDYVRGDIVERAAMSIAPFQLDGPANDLRDYLEPVINAGITSGELVIYAFGERWGPEADVVDKYFGFLPGNGVHDIHMNQGSAGRFSRYNGPNQDGALVLHDTARDHWSAVYLAFQSQSWTTDPVTGDALHAPPEHPPTNAGFKPSLSIVAALINPANPEEDRETVTLINRSDTILSLSGWRLMDDEDRAHPLAGEVVAGETLRVSLAGSPMRLRNKRGAIALVDADGAVAHRVGYEKSEIAREAWTTVF